MPPSSFQPLLETTRGDIVESIHYGALAVVDSGGKLFASIGDPQQVVYLRSSAKPFQALPFVEAGGVEHFGLTPKELALICASHSGTEEQVAVARAIQTKVGIQEDQLQCGIHPPSNSDTYKTMLRRGEEPSINHNNCSGKHSGMLAHAQLKELPLTNYLDPEHGVQRSILQTFAEMCDLPTEEIIVGTDGCSAPNFAVPLYNAALAWARLVDPSDLSPKREAACQSITEAMSSHPDMVAGPGRFDTLLMGTGRGKIVSKGGAEGYAAVGLLPGALEEGSRALGFVIKIADGDSRGRAVGSAAVETLRQLGGLDEEQMQALKKFAPETEITNHKKIIVGVKRTTIQLDRN